MEKQELLVELQSRGARLEIPVEDHGRRGGAGPSDDKAFLLAGVAAMVPTLGDFVKSSPFTVIGDGDGGFCVTHEGEPVLPVSFAPTPKFYQLSTAEGIPYQKIAVLHSRDVLATTVSQRCIRWRKVEDRCQFCAIENSLEDEQTVALKTPENLAEVAEAARRLDGVSHMVLTTGTLNGRDMGVRYLTKCVRAIKEAVPEMGIQVQFEPPLDLEEMVPLAEAGTDTVGIHLESFDQKTRERIVPGKARIGVERYFEAFQRAVEIFGRNQVSSYVIVGFGDSEDTIVEGCRRLAEIGAYPFVVPLRPLLGTPLENTPAPEPELMQSIYRRVAANNRRYGLSYRNSKAGCTRCGACSGLTAFE
ncbi:MAG: MSMEG_0568 family radical SAM protein [Deltaproteobacteria bacterium]|nr:MSMEG_0568 family radical SAM protein [Deltaproteobacteria bacterium]